MDEVLVREPGKIIVFGEHFVVHGSRALSLAINSFVNIHVAVDDAISITLMTNDKKIFDLTDQRENSISKYIYTLISSLSLPPVNLKIEVGFPISAGLGSSASIASGIARALYTLKFNRAPDKDEVYRMADRLERDIHGNPSGIDLNTILEGGIILYDGASRKVVEKFYRDDIPFVITDTGDRRITGRLVGSVADMKRRVGEIFGLLVRTADSISQLGFKLLRRGDLEGLGRLMMINQGLLYAIGVSNSKIDYLIYKSLDMGAYGAKLTGAGGGGCIISLCDEGVAGDIADEFNKMGYPSFIVHPYSGGHIADR